MLPGAVFSSFSLAHVLAKLKVTGPWLVNGPVMANQSPATKSLAKKSAKLKEENTAPGFHKLKLWENIHNHRIREKY